MEVHHLFNITFRKGYYLLIAIPVFYFLVSTFSYFSVLTTLGEVPKYDSGLALLIKQKAKAINIFPVRYGNVLILLLLIDWFLFWIWILLNYLASRFLEGIIYHKKLVFLLTLVIVISFITAHIPELGGWYLAYVLD